MHHMGWHARREDFITLVRATDSFTIGPTPEQETIKLYVVSMRYERS